MLSCIFALLTAVLIVVADQLTKIYIMSSFTLGETADFIPKLIDITYIHNDGGAWGMLGGYTWILLSVTAVVLLVCIALMLRLGINNKAMFWAMSLVLGGGIGNMIDRIFRGGEVVDFLHFTFWPSFPVFNVADCAVVIGCGLLVLYFVLDMLRDFKRKNTSAAEPFLDEQDNTEV